MRPGDKDPFLDGFSIRTVIGAVFVGVIMMPATIYLGLVAGQSIGPAAEWVTIILFTELARRSFGSLRKQEIYLLFYVASGLTGAGVATITSDSAGFTFQNLIWKAYMRTSSSVAKFGIADKIPDWAIPPASSQGLVDRNLSHPDFYKPILLVVLLMLLGRFTWIAIGNLLFRVVADKEKLPFPLAKIDAAGAMALAEDPSEKDNWRWRWFSKGTIIGVIFGFFLVGIPAVTGLFLSKPLTLFPIPWADFTPEVERWLPTCVLVLSFDVGALLTGMVLPFASTVGAAVGILGSAFILSPVLFYFGFYPGWRPGGGAISTNIAVEIDFWMSAGMGIGIAIATIGLYQAVSDLVQRARDNKHTALRTSFLPPPPPGRGDYSVKIAIVAFLISTGGYTIIAHKLLPLFPLAIILGFAFFVTPLMSYVDARIRGMTGGGFDMPGLKFGSVRYSGYSGVDFWFAPLPISNYGGAAQFFKALELTRTKFSSVLKAELLMFPLSAVCGYGFWSFFWKMTPIPSAAYPFVAKWWPLWAMRQSLIISSTSGQQAWAKNLIKPEIILGAAIIGILLYLLFKALRLPILFFYGFITSLNGFSSSILFLLAGAFLTRYHFNKRYGKENWGRFAPVLAAGFACGMGLVGMLAVGLTLIVKAVINLPY